MGFVGIVALLLFCNCVDVRGQAAQTSDSSVTQQAGASATADGDTTGTSTASNTQTPTDNAGGQTSSVISHETTDGSGSPAILSGNDGRDRDGTNNVQRASMNMVGSPTENLELNDDESVDPDTEMQDRQEYSQDKRKSEQSQPDTR